MNFLIDADIAAECGIEMPPGASRHGVAPKGGVCIPMRVAAHYGLPGASERGGAYAFTHPENYASDIFTLSPKVKDGELSLALQDPIGAYFGVSAQHFRDAMNDAEDYDSIHLTINSPGGSVWEGRSIQTILADFDGDVRVTIQGLCASAATMPLLAAGDGAVRMSESAQLMIHNVMVGMIGNKEEFEDLVVKIMRPLDAQLAKDYAAFTGGEAKDMAAMMGEETWMDSGQARELGFVDEIMTAVKRRGGAKDSGETPEQRALKGWLASNGGEVHESHSGTEGGAG